MPWNRTVERDIKMFSHHRLLFALLLLHLAPHPLSAEEPAPTKAPAPSESLFRIGGMAQAAADLRHSGEAFERFAKLLASVAESASQSLATMSSEFDPFGFKTAYRTIGNQNEMLQSQRDIIQSLQQREIDRLQRENNALSKRLKKLRKHKRSGK